MQSPEQTVHSKPISSHPSSSQSLTTALLSPQQISQPSQAPHHTSPHHTSPHHTSPHHASSQHSTSHALSPTLLSSQQATTASPNNVPYRNIQETSLKQPSPSLSRALHVVETVLPEVGNSPTHKPSNDSYVGTPTSNVGTTLTPKHRTTAAPQDIEAQDIAMDQSDEKLAPDTLRNKTVKDLEDLPRSTSEEKAFSTSPSYIASQEKDMSKTEPINSQLPSSSLNLDGKMSLTPVSSKIYNSDNNSKVVNNRMVQNQESLLENSPQCKLLPSRGSSVHSSSLSAQTSNISPNNNFVGQHSQRQETRMSGMMGNHNPGTQPFGNSQFPTNSGNLGMDSMNAQSRHPYPINNSSSYSGNSNFHNMGNNPHIYNDPGYSRRNWNRPPAPIGDLGPQAFGNMSREGPMGEGPPPRKRDHHSNTHTNNSQFKMPRSWNYHNS